MPHYPDQLRPNPNAQGALATEFGSGVGVVNAETLIRSNQLKMTQELATAQLLAADEEATEALDLDAVAEAAGVDRDDLFGPPTVRGGYVVWQAKVGDQIVKDALILHKDGSLEAPSIEDSPERQAMRAQMDAAVELQDARSQAKDIIAAAERKAREILGQASKPEARRAPAEGGTTSARKPAAKKPAAKKPAARRTTKKS